MKRLKEDIANRTFKKIYLLYGEEDYLKRYYREKLAEAILPAKDSMNYSCFEGKGIRVEELIDLAETMPFFAEKRVIVVENSGFFKNASLELSDYLKTVPDTACFIFIENEIDKRGRAYKAAKDAGCVVEFAYQDEKALLGWIGQALNKEKKKISRTDGLYLIGKVGSDMNLLDKELDKLCSYTYGRAVVTKEDIDAICTTQLQNKIFDMVEAVAGRQQKRALDYYEDLLALKEPPMRILYLLSRQFRILYQVKEMEKLGKDQASIAGNVKIPPFVVGKYIKQSKGFSSREILRVMEDAADLEELVKTGRMNDRMSVELFIVRHSIAPE